MFFSWYTLYMYTLYKKQRGGKISFALPCAPGDVRLVPVAV